MVFSFELQTMQFTVEGGGLSLRQKIPPRFETRKADEDVTCCHDIRGGYYLLYDFRGRNKTVDRSD